MTSITGIPKPGEKITSPEALRRYAECLHDQPAPEPVRARINDGKRKRPGFICFGVPGHFVHWEAMSAQTGGIERIEIVPCHFGEDFPRLELLQRNGRYAPMTEWKVPQPMPESSWALLRRYGLEGHHELDDPLGIGSPVYDEEDVVQALREAESK